MFECRSAAIGHRGKSFSGYRSADELVHLSDPVSLCSQRAQSKNWIMDSFDTHLTSLRDRFRLWPVIGKWSRGVPLVSSPRRSRGMITARHKTICRYKGHNLNKVASARQMRVEFIFVSQKPRFACPCVGRPMFVSLPPSLTVWPGVPTKRHQHFGENRQICCHSK